MNVDVDEHPLELVEQLEWRDQAPGDPGNPFLRETTPFDWDIQGRGHPLRFPKDPYGTEAHWRIGGSMTQDQGISQPKDDRIFQNKNLNPNNAKLDPTTNSYQCQSQQSYSAHSLRMSCLKEFFPDRRRHWAFHLSLNSNSSCGCFKLIFPIFIRWDCSLLCWSHVGTCQCALQGVKIVKLVRLTLLLRQFRRVHKLFHAVLSLCPQKK